MLYPPFHSVRQTGPNTPAGKAIAARNATTHGLFARDIVLTHLGEDPRAYEALYQEFCAQIQPQTLLEQHYVEQIAAASWRLRRLDRWQAQIYEDNSLNEDQRLDKLDRVLRHEITLRRQIDKAVRQLGRSGADREIAETKCPPAETESRALPAAQPMPPDFDPVCLDNTYESAEDREKREKWENEMAEQAKQFPPTEDGFYVYPGGRPIYVDEREWQEVSRLRALGEKKQARKLLEDCRRACIDDLTEYLASDRALDEQYGPEDDDEDEEEDEDE